MGFIIQFRVNFTYLYMSVVLVLKRIEGPKYIFN